MIHKLKRIAIGIQVLRVPSILITLISLASLIVIIIFFENDRDNRLTIPLLIVMLWGMSTYSYIITFRSVPEIRTDSLRFFGKLKLAITRAWYCFLGVIFLGATVTIIISTIRMISIWLRE